MQGKHGSKYYLHCSAWFPPLFLDQILLDDLIIYILVTGIRIFQEIGYIFLTISASHS